VTVCIVWGSTYLGIRIVVADLSPMFAMGTRFLAAGAALYLWLAVRGAPRPDRRDWRNAVLLGALLVVFGNGCVAIAERTVSSGLAALFVAAAPLAAAVFGGLLGEAWPTRAQWCAIALGMFGVTLLGFGKGFGGDGYSLGMLAAAVLGWSLGSVLCRERVKVPAGLQGVAMQMLTGGALMLAASLLLQEPWALPATAASAGAWLYLVVAGSLIAFPAYIYLLGVVPAHVATSYCFVSPVIAAALGVAVAGETLTPGETGAAALIVGAAFLLVRARRYRA
ncbi:MAG TPA: EamA family transporter, partial [Burkholderiaceae bacterium]|nr:EamA family transporter [Burkholderiaceae bacterium]